MAGKKINTIKSSIQLLLHVIEWLDHFVSFRSFDRVFDLFFNGFWSQ